MIDYVSKCLQENGMHSQTMVRSTHLLSTYSVFSTAPGVRKSTKSIAIKIPVGYTHLENYQKKIKQTGHGRSSRIVRFFQTKLQDTLVESKFHKNIKLQLSISLLHMIIESDLRVFPCLCKIPPLGLSAIVGRVVVWTGRTRAYHRNGVSASDCVQQWVVSIAPCRT